MFSKKKKNFHKVFSPCSPRQRLSVDILKSILGLLFNFRTSIQCSSLCVNTPGCSAFRFDDETAICEIGSSLKLVKYESESTVELIVNVFTSATGKLQKKTG